MSLNRKRRIFRSGVSLPRVALPSPGLLLAAVGGLLLAGGAAWVLVRPSNAPALAPASQHLSAPAGRLAVIDGDTLRVGDDVVRLAGIVAPARDTLCRSAAGAQQDCGVAAANALASLVRNAPITCKIHGHDTRGRPLADCQVRGISLSDAQVRGGWARAQATNLKAAEAAAQSAGRGLWNTGGSF